MDFLQFDPQAPAGVQLLVACGGGLLTLFTPCVYPLIPITLSVFGATRAKSRLEALGLSAAYVLGIALTYTTLGLLAATSGAIFGSILRNPFVVIALSGFLFTLALGSLEILELRFLYRLQSAANRAGGGGYRGAMVMGLASGAVAAPCVAPILTVILGYAAASGNTLWGGTLLFAYALGLGFPFLILGTFASLLNRLPRSGEWLRAVKLLMAVLLIVFALYLLRNAFPQTLPLELLADSTVALALLLLSGVIAALHGFRRDLKPAIFLSSFLISLAVLPVFVKVYAGEAPTEGAAAALQWHTSEQSAFAEAAASDKPVMLDLFAEWCVACKEFDHKTFPDPAVQRLLGRFAIGRIDFTEESESADALAARYAVAGLPCILFLDSAGNELPGTRVTGFQPPEQFSRHLEKVLGSN